MHWWNWVAFGTFAVLVIWKPEILTTRLPVLTFEDAREH